MGKLSTQQRRLSIGHLVIILGTLVFGSGASPEVGGVGRLATVRCLAVRPLQVGNSGLAHLLLFLAGDWLELAGGVDHYCPLR